MRGIWTPKINSHIINSHIKRPRMTDNQRIGSRKKVISGSHIREIADKKTAYNEGRLYLLVDVLLALTPPPPIVTLSHTFLSPSPPMN